MTTKCRIALSETAVEGIKLRLCSRLSVLTASPVSEGAVPVAERPCHQSMSICDGDNSGGRAQGDERRSAPIGTGAGFREGVDVRGGTNPANPARTHHPLPPWHTTAHNNHTSIAMLKHGQSWQAIRAIRAEPPWTHADLSSFITCMRAACGSRSADSRSRATRA